MKHMKKIIFSVLTLALAIFIGFKIYASKQNLNNLKEKYPHKSFNINEELVSDDGYLKVKVFKIESDYTGIDLDCTMELNEEIKEKGFENFSTGSFSLMVNPIKEESDFTRDIRGNVVAMQFQDYDSIKIHFDRENLEYDNDDLIRIYFTGATLIKQIHEVIEFEFEEGIKNKEIELEGLGKYYLESFNYDKDKHEIDIKSRTESYLKKPLRVRECFYGYKDGTRYETKGGGGSSGYEPDAPLTISGEWNYKVDSFFSEAEKVIIEINNIEMDVGNDYGSKTYFQFRFSELE